jgi:hypothetical protein
MSGIVTTIRPDGSPHSTVVWVEELPLRFGQCCCHALLPP